MRKKQLVSLLIVLILTIICPYIVLGSNIEMNSDETRIESGDEVTISIKVKDVDIEDGMNSIQGQLIYSKDDWEKVKVDDIKSKNNWTITYNDEDTEAEGKFILINFGLAKTEEQELVEITLKSKRKIINKESEIKLVELYTTDGENMIELEEVSEQIELQGNMAILLIIIILVVIIIITLIIIGIKIKREKVRK